MKVLQINCVYGRGSTGLLTQQLHHALLAEDEEPVACYGFGPVSPEENVLKLNSDLYSRANHLRANITGNMYGGCRLSTDKLIRIIRRSAPDVVHLQCVNGYFVNIYRLVSWLKREKIPTVLTLHAEFMYTAGCGHAMDCEKWMSGCGHCPSRGDQTKGLTDRTAFCWKKMERAFSGFEDLDVVSVSPWLMERAKRSPILGDKRHQCILNGVDCSVFTRRSDEALRERLLAGKEKLVLHVTPFFSDREDSFKGGQWLIRLAKLLNERSIRFVVVGNASLREQLPDNVSWIGPVRDRELLASMYAVSDCSVIVSKRETFSMVTAESICCGTPVVGFRAGAPEAIAPGEFSRFVPYGDVEALADALLGLLSAAPDREAVSKTGRELFSNEKMCESYLRLYRSRTCSN